MSDPADGPQTNLFNAARKASDREIRTMEARAPHAARAMEYLYRADAGPTHAPVPVPSGRLAEVLKESSTTVAFRRETVEIIQRQLPDAGLADRRELLNELSDAYEDLLAAESRAMAELAESEFKP